MKNLNAQAVLEQLKAGNLRYVEKIKNAKEHHQPPPILVEEQLPSAIILGCSDARVPVELIFDQKIGRVVCHPSGGQCSCPVTDWFGRVRCREIWHRACGGART